MIALPCGRALAQEAATVTSGQPQDVADTAPGAPALVLNEVLFDSVGFAGSDGSWQWVELCAKRSTNTSGWQVQDALGQTLYSLPGLSLAAGAHVVVLLGPSDPELENLDPTQGPITLTSGLAFADHLGVSQGGVRLVRNNKVQDEVYWGSNPVQQPFVDLSFPAGAVLGEGDSIGRNSSSDYTGTSADWAVSGGANSNGITPGAKNEVELPTAGDVILYGDSFVNSIFLGMSVSLEEAGWIKVASTSPSLLSLTTASTGEQATAIVQHSFDLLIDGAPVTLNGTVTSTFTRTRTELATSEDWNVGGTLASSNGLWGLTFRSSRSSSGAHLPQTQVDYATDYIWKHFGVDYANTVSGQYVERRVGQGLFTGSDSRTGSDWGGAGLKTGDIAWTRTRVGDGHWRLASTLQRSYPSLLPKPGRVQAAAGTENLDQTLDLLAEGTGMVTGKVLAYDQDVDGFVVAQLRPGETGTVDSSQSPNGNGSIDFRFSSLYPLQNGSGGAYDYEVFIEGTTTYFGGKTLSTGSGGVRVDGTEIYSIQFAIDPPQTGQKTLWQRAKDFGATTVTCVAGGVGAQVVVEGPAGKRALIRMIGKAAAKKAIPFVGWAVTIGCLGVAVGDQVWGD